MEPPQRKYNLVPCLIISAIGLVVGAVIVTGLFVPLTVYLFDLLPHGSLGISQETFTWTCQGGLIGVPAFILLVWWIASRSRQRSGLSPSRPARRAKRTRLDTLMEKEEEADGQT